MGNAEYVTKLEAAEVKLQELKSNVATMGKEAGAAMAAVEGQQQRLTLQRLISMVFTIPLTYLFVILCSYSYYSFYSYGDNSSYFIFGECRLNQRETIIKKFCRYLIN